jgi:hypothetical protein
VLHSTVIKLRTCIRRLYSIFNLEALLSRCTPDQASYKLKTTALSYQSPFVCQFLQDLFGDEAGRSLYSDTDLPPNLFLTSYNFSLLDNLRDP